MLLEAETPLAQQIAARAKQNATTVKELAEGRADLYKFNPFTIEIEPGFNARDIDSPDVQEHIDNLAQSISVVGLKRPVKVRMKNGTPYLVDGECRLRAVKRAIEIYGAEIRTIKVEIADKTMTEADATLSLVIENSGLDLTPLEKAVVFKRLVSFGWSINAIAESAGCSSVRVTQMLELNMLPEVIKKMISERKIASTLARTIAKDNNFDEASTIQCINDSLAEAESQGRKRVTARNVSGPRTSFRKVLAEVFGRATVEDDVEADEGEEATVLVAMSRDQYDQIRKVLKLA